MTESWQIACPRCRWPNSGASARCAKCGQPLRRPPGMLVAGERAGAPKPVVTPKVVQPGGFFPRLIALIIDSMILLVLEIGIYFLWQAQTRPSQVAAGTSQATLSAQAFEQNLVLAGALVVLATFYFVGSWNLLGGSPGMLILNLRIVDKKGTTLGFGRALLRWVWYLLLSPLSPVSAISVAVGPDKRALHDALAGSYVIQYLDPDKVAASLPTAEAGETETPPGLVAGRQASPMWDGPSASPPPPAPPTLEAPPVETAPGPPPLPPPPDHPLDFIPRPPDTAAGPGHHTGAAAAPVAPHHAVPFVPSVVPANSDPSAAAPGEPPASPAEGGTDPPG